MTFDDIINVRMRGPARHPIVSSSVQPESTRLSEVRFLTTL